MKFFMDLLDKIPWLKSHKRIVSLVGLQIISVIGLIQANYDFLDFVKSDWLLTASAFFTLWGGVALGHARHKAKNGG